MPVEKVLVVDYERLVRWSRQKCKEWGYQILGAAGGTRPAPRPTGVSRPSSARCSHARPKRHPSSGADQERSRRAACQHDHGRPDNWMTSTARSSWGRTISSANHPTSRSFASPSRTRWKRPLTHRSSVVARRREKYEGTGYHDFVAVSPKTTERMSFVEKVAASAATTILIQGESGTGKDLVAKTVHYGRSRQNGPFVAINCSAIPELSKNNSWNHLTIKVRRTPEVHLIYQSISLSGQTTTPYWTFEHGSAPN